MKTCANFIFFHKCGSWPGNPGGSHPAFDHTAGSPCDLVGSGDPALGHLDWPVYNLKEKIIQKNF
jgi:hypothetical protein